MNADTRKQKVTLTLSGAELVELYILLDQKTRALRDFDLRVGAAYRELMNQEAHQLNEKASSKNKPRSFEIWIKDPEGLCIGSGRDGCFTKTGNIFASLVAAVEFGEAEITVPVWKVVSTHYETNYTWSRVIHTHFS